MGQQRLLTLAYGFQVPLFSWLISYLISSLVGWLID